ncbi:MAG: trypsin-like peptidase domain-containing protein [Anaerolineales bacterium]|nr:trypsin-like peptidase domain-containing protein [Anaerolineales bacterium]
MPLPPKSRRLARVGQFVLAIGRPSTNGIESSFGTVNSIGGPVRTGRGSMLERYIKTDVVSYPGFSGGPLVNGDGTIFGIHTSGFETAERSPSLLILHGRSQRLSRSMARSNAVISASAVRPWNFPLMQGKH